MKTLGCFALRFAILFGLLAWPWPGMREVFSAGFRAQTRLLVGATLPAQFLRVETFSDPRHPDLDTLMVLADRQNPGSPGGQSAVEIPFDSISQAWIPLAMLIALCGATPLPWFKRLKALLAGALVIQLLVAATILVAVSFALKNATLPTWPRLPLMLANRLLVENIWFSFVPPFLFWAVWLAWGGHWEHLKGAVSRKDAG